MVYGAPQRAVGQGLQDKSSYWLGAGIDVFRALTLSNKEIMTVAAQYAAHMDAQHTIAPWNNPYAIRLTKLTERHTFEDGLRLNYRVYLSPNINAFALADGSIRVYSGLMDVMTDEEILAVIGHEIGHVRNNDHKDKLRTALLTSAARKAAATSDGMV
ncbi:MAG: M48 family metalloprotease, partial [Bacteroidota bacterium]|nr:M48 family metalloprotease [Candidatus Kapabacteria bacterium]MDW8221159.1 M48 family metalloprotease [Bacteroidota bacterium]